MDAQKFEFLKLGIYMNSGDWKAMLEQLRQEKVTPAKGAQLVMAAEELLKKGAQEYQLLAIEILREARKDCWRGWSQLGVECLRYLIDALMTHRGPKSQLEAQALNRALKEKAEKGNTYAQDAVAKLAHHF